LSMTFIVGCDKGIGFYNQGLEAEKAFNYELALEQYNEVLNYPKSEKYDESVIKVEELKKTIDLANGMLSEVRGLFEDLREMNFDKEQGFSLSEEKLFFEKSKQLIELIDNIEAISPKHKYVVVYREDFFSYLGNIAHNYSSIARLEKIGFRSKKGSSLRQANRKIERNFSKATQIILFSDNLSQQKTESELMENAREMIVDHFIEQGDKLLYNKEYQKAGNKYNEISKIDIHSNKINERFENLNAIMEYAPINEKGEGVFRGISKYKFSMIGDKIIVTFSPYLPRNDNVVTQAMLDLMNKVYGYDRFRDESPGTVNMAGQNVIIFSGKIGTYYFLILKDITGEVAGWSMWWEK